MLSKIYRSITTIKWECHILIRFWGKFTSLCCLYKMTIISKSIPFVDWIEFAQPQMHLMPCYRIYYRCIYSQYIESLENPCAHSIYCRSNSAELRTAFGALPSQMLGLPLYLIKNYLPIYLSHNSSDNSLKANSTCYLYGNLSENATENPSQLKQANSRCLCTLWHRSKFLLYYDLSIRQYLQGILYVCRQFIETILLNTIILKWIYRVPCWYWFVIGCVETIKVERLIHHSLPHIQFINAIYHRSIERYMANE